MFNLDLEGDISNKEKTMSLNTEAIKAFLIFKGGEIDKTASLKRFSDQMDLFETLGEINQARIASAVGAVFDKWRTAAIRKEALVNFALSELNASIQNYDDLRRGVENYIRDNTGYRGKAIFGIRPGAGFIRWSDWAEKA